jgi:RNA polymerase sigma-70 factor (ECF subfamily)
MTAAMLQLFALPVTPIASRSDDVRLVERAQRREPDAFDQLYRRHVSFVHRRLTRLVGPIAEREDLVQQVFLEVFRSLPRFRGEAAFTTWLHHIVVAVAYEQLRRRTRRPTEPLSDEQLAELIAPEATPEASARRREEVKRALGFLDRLTPKKRIAFVLRVVEELSLDEIGELVDARPAAVGQRVKHAQREMAHRCATRCSPSTDRRSTRSPRRASERGSRLRSRTRRSSRRVAPCGVDPGSPGQRRSQWSACS